MTPQSFTRRSARVEAMRLDSVRALYAAHEWARAYGIAAYPGDLESVLYIHGSDGTRLPARLGQWLTRNPDTGEFAVFDDGDEPGQFGWEHRSIVGVRNG